MKELILSDDPHQAFFQYGNMCLDGGIIIDEENKNEILRIITAFKNQKAICIQGNPGSGKTLAMEILRRITHPKSKLAFTHLNAFDLVNEHDENCDAGEWDYKRWDKNHILINEFGTEKLGKYKTEVLKEFVLFRHQLWERNKIRTHFTTNLRDQGIIDRYGVFIFSRITAMCEMIKLGGHSTSTDRRPLHNFKGFPDVQFPEWLSKEEKYVRDTHARMKEEAKTVPTPRPGQIKGAGTLIREQFERAFKKPNT